MAKRSREHENEPQASEHASNDARTSTEGARARMSDAFEAYGLEHEDLRRRTERARRAWSETSDTTVPGKRARAKVAELAREWTPLAIATLVDVMISANDAPAAKVSAARELLDRGYGKAREHVEIEHIGPDSRQLERLEALHRNPETRAHIVAVAEAIADAADEQPS